MRRYFYSMGTYIKKFVILPLDIIRCQWLGDLKTLIRDVITGMNRDLGHTWEKLTFRLDIFHATRGT
jgi:hypothetical protein